MMKDKKPLYRVLSLKGLGGDIESRGVSVTSTNQASKTTSSFQRMWKIYPKQQEI